MSNLFYFKESLEDSFIYKTFSNSNDILPKMLECIRNSTLITKDYIEEQYIQIKKSAVSPLSREVLEAYDDGLIEIRYTTGNSRLPTAIPYVVRRDGNRIVATIFINAFTSLENDNLTIPTKNLYVFMESAYIALLLHKYPEKIKRNSSLCKICMTVYTEMVMKILVKEYALTMDRILYDKITFVVSRFFLTKVWGLTDEKVIAAYAASQLKYATTEDIFMINKEYMDKNINDISDLIVFISSCSNRLKTLNVKYFIEKFISLYHAPALLSLDYLPYLFFVINNVLVGSFIVSQNALSDIVKSTVGISRYYGEISKSLM